MDEALFSATYVDNYIDSVENLPHDVQRQLTMIRDIDVQYRSKFSYQRNQAKLKPNKKPKNQKKLKKEKEKTTIFMPDKSCGGWMVQETGLCCP